MSTGDCKHEASVPTKFLEHVAGLKIQKRTYINK